MSERLSFFATTIVAALGWLLTYYVDRVTTAPTIEYTIASASAQSGLKTTFRLANISRTQSFSPVEVHFLPRTKSPITAMKVVPVEPASEGPSEEKVEAGQAWFVIERLMPGGAVDFALTTAGPNPPKMHIDSPSAAVRLTQPTFETWLVKNETCAILALIAVWLALLIAIFLFRPKQRQEGPETIRVEIVNTGGPR